MNVGYGWIITRDLLAETYGDASEVGTAGPFGIDPSVLVRLQNGEGRKFRLFSDDEDEADNLDYEGLLILVDEDNDELLFGPLDDFGAPNVGSTAIKYKEGRSWKFL